MSGEVEGGREGVGSVGEVWWVFKNLGRCVGVKEVWGEMWGSVGKGVR